uniref:thiopurine S-methyltransferase n=1 Tax=Fodinibius sp. TaxID=1872440 RepID=UPI003566698E
MEVSYWKSRWRKDNIGWHIKEVYPPLRTFWPQLNLPPGARVLVPLCGKSHDLNWLVAQGARVTGVEVSLKALREVMRRSAASFTRTESHGFPVFQSESMELWQGDFQQLPHAPIHPADAVYDKSSLVALPAAMRKKYARKLLELRDSHTQILLQSFEYKQDEMNGPPFSVPEREI